MTMTTPCVIYRRYSSDEQGKGQGETLETQLAACHAFAAKLGLQPPFEVLTGEGQSAYKGDHLQPGADLYEFVQRVQRGVYAQDTILIAHRLDRLSRRPVEEAMAWIHSLTSRGVRIGLADMEQVFAANPSLETFLGTAIRAAQNHEESRKKSERVIDSRVKLWAKAERREGKWTNLAGRPPLWLARNEGANGWIENKHRVSVIVQIYEWASQGVGVPTIVKRLNSELNEPRWGVDTKKTKDKTWGVATVRQLLENPAVEGDFVGRTGTFKGRRIRGFYRRVVDADLAARARASMASRTKVKGVSSGLTTLFSGRTVCGACGRQAFATSNEKKGRRYVYVRCEAAGLGRSCDNTRYYRYDKFEAAALDLSIDLALDDRFFEAPDDLRELRTREAELEQVIAHKRAHRRELMSDAEFTGDEDAREVARGLKAEIDGYVAQLAETNAEIIAAAGAVDAAEHVRRVNNIREAANSDQPSIREPAREKLRKALAGIVNLISVEQQDGRKVFTLSLKGGVLGAQFDDKGNLRGVITHALGHPLSDALSGQNRRDLEPLLRRLETGLASCAG